MSIKTKNTPNKVTYRNLFIVLLASLFFLMRGINNTVAAECNADLSQGGTSCTMTASLTLNGTYSLNMNTTSSVFNLTSPTITNGSLTTGSLLTNSQVDMALAPSKEAYISDASWT